MTESTSFGLVDGGVWYPLPARIKGRRRQHAAPIAEASIHQYNHALAVQMLDLLLEFFADETRWMQGDYHDGGNRRCLMGALNHLQRNHHIPYAGAAYVLQQALPSRQSGLVSFNDRLCASVVELRSVLMKARALAIEDAEAALAAAAMERKLLAEAECYRAARAPPVGSGAVGNALAWAETELQEARMAGGTIHFDEIARPEMLDPKIVRNLHRNTVLGSAVWD